MENAVLRPRQTGKFSPHRIMGAKAMADSDFYVIRMN